MGTPLAMLATSALAVLAAITALAAMAAAAPARRGARARWPRALLLCAMVALPGLADAAGAGDQAGSEDAIKAAYLYKLRNYVEWPASAGARHMLIGVVGGDNVVAHLLELPGVGTGAGAAVQLRRLRPGDPLDGVAILFVDDAYWHRAGATVSQARAHAVLVVSESVGALDEGSIINFRLIDERIRFEISLANAEQSGLKLSSQLLALAVAVARK